MSVEILDLAELMLKPELENLHRKQPALLLQLLLLRKQFMSSLRADAYRVKVCL